ncbi:hypothetical protein [Streptomyces sp. NPDC048659]|uniref:hypothetical protein n=1 Tax=Streptomyces sp. NPDC048659 TaxID=3155489 RepID=UPI0034337C41
MGKDGELSTAGMWAARALVVLAGAAVTAICVALCAQTWRAAGTGLGIGSERGRFVATACEVDSDGKGGASTECVGTFTSADGRTVPTGRLRAPGADSMAPGDSYGVRCAVDGGVCVRVEALEVTARVVGAVLVTVVTLLVPAGTWGLARHVHSGAGRGGAGRGGDGSGRRRGGPASARTHLAETFEIRTLLTGFRP